MDCLAIQWIETGPGADVASSLAEGGTSMTRAMRLALPLLLAACSSAPDQGKADAGPDAGPAARYIDLRFRGVGETLSRAGVGFGGGAAPGDPSQSLTLTGPGFGEGLFVSDFFEWWPLTYPDAGTYVTTVAWAGTACDSILTDPLSNGATVLGLGGDPTTFSGPCTAISVRPLDAGVGATSVTGLSLGSSGIDSLNEHDFTRQYVVTALSEVDAGLYAFVAEGHPAQNEQFENVFVLTPSEDVPSVADELSDAGLVITAATAGPSGIALVGTRPLDGGVRRVSLTLRGDIEPGPELDTLLAGSFAPVAFLLEHLPDGGVQSTTIGQK